MCKYLPLLKPVGHSGLKTIKYSLNGKVAKIQFNRPHALNSLNSEMMSEIKTAIKSIAEDDNVAVLVLTGDEKSFSGKVR